MMEINVDGCMVVFMLWVSDGSNNPLKKGFNPDSPDL